MGVLWMGMDVLVKLRIFQRWLVTHLTHEGLTATEIYGLYFPFKEYRCFAKWVSEVMFAG